MRVEVDFQLSRVRLAMAPGEFRLGIEQIDLAWTTVLKQANHCLGVRRVVRASAGQWAREAAVDIVSQQVGQGEATEAAGIMAEKGAAQ